MKKIHRVSVVAIILDVIFLFSSIVLMMIVLPDFHFTFKENFSHPLYVFIFIWLIESIILKKYIRPITKNTKDYLLNIIRINLIILITAGFILFWISNGYSKIIILGIFLPTTLLELFISNLYLLAFRIAPSIEIDTLGFNDFNGGVKKSTTLEHSIDPGLKEKIKKFACNDSLDFIQNNMVQAELSNTLFVATRTRFNIDNQDGAIENIVNLQTVNNIQRINKFFESVNQKLPINGVFIGCVETSGLRKARLFKKYIWGLSAVYYFLDFILKRIFPKLILTRGIYFFLTSGRNRVLSKAETFGRLYSCGFELCNDAKINNLLYFSARKIKEPVYDLSPTYGPFIKLRRVGKDGRLFNVFKLRTMHPYAEYLQNYVYQKNKLDKGGKLKDDFRVTTIGKIFRRSWIDELPMLINLIKGNIKLVGIRPVSQHYFNLLSEELKEKRIKTKPGLLPPFYLDLPNTLDEIMASELKYLDLYAQNPLRTDFIYFWKIWYNIIVKKARSQ